MSWYEIVFGIPLLLGLLLVLCSALGVADFDTEGELGPEAHDAEPSEGPLTPLGVGRVPLVIGLMLLLLLFGGAGLAVSPAMVSALGAPLGAVLSICVAGLISLGGGTWLARKIARHLPSVETYASSKADLVTCQGSIVLLLGTHEAIARVSDRGGAELRLRCIASGERLHVGERVVVLAYDRNTDRYLVERAGLS